MGAHSKIIKISGGCENLNFDPIQPKLDRVPKYIVYMLVLQNKSDPCRD